jgi:ribulose-phosphate 3-epimerase
MTVEPGFGGQKFMPGMLPKVRELRKAIDRQGLKVWLQVDGGIGPNSVSLAAAAGADSLVAGSAIFQAKNPVSALRALESAAQKAFTRRYLCP